VSSSLIQAKQTYSILYGKSEIEFQLSFSKRKSLEIAVHPDKSVFIKAPEGTEQKVIEEKVLKRARWIKRQIRYFDQFDPRTPARKYVSGESHLYLGRKYRLKVVTGVIDSVCLKNGFFIVTSKSSSADHIESLLSAWYREKANYHLYNVFESCWEKFGKEGLSKPTIKISKLRKRWGSLSKKQRLTLNVDLIKAPKECIEYVVIHELCHLYHHNHGAEFYQLLERSLTDWEIRKQKLEMTLV